MFKFKRKKKITLSPELDTHFYGQYYSDLSAIAEEGLHRHWQKFGQKEKRYPSLQQLLKDHDIHDVQETEFDIDPDFYCRNYPDVSKNGKINKTQAKVHWLTHGKKEGRARTLVEWMKIHGGYNTLDLNESDIIAVFERNKKNEQDVTIQLIQDVLSGNVSQPIKFADSPVDNAAFYERLGKSFYLKYKGNGSEHERQATRSAYRMALYFYPTARVLELLGNTYLDAGDYKTAAEIYYEAINQQSLNSDDNSSRWLFLLLAQAESANNLHLEALTAITKGLHEYPEFTSQREQLDQYVNKYYLSFAGKLQLLSSLDKRIDLVDQTWLYTKTIYKAYITANGASECIKPKPQINHNKILIVGDYHVPQCVRYRIEQKAEQLESQGKVVTCVDWTTLAENANELALHDIVIFYRVPAVPEVIKSIARINAAGKISIYEIDDLIFDTIYPANLDTYGGYLSLDTHIELRKGMALFNSAARLCSYGLASTLPLCDKLKALVTTGICLLHRNGLDKHSIIKPVDRENRDFIDIFYGSGTQAHNSDFIEQALPALTQILVKYPHVRLVIAGYLKLPTSFTERFASQLKQVPPLSSIKAYWSLLQQADINLAVLHDDVINACKSELKWFEAACFGIPSVVSSTQNYRDVLVHGEDAYLATNEEEWVIALSHLIEDASLRKQIADKALTKVKQNYSVVSLGKELVAQLEALAPAKTKKRKIALVNVFYPPQAIGGATRVVADNVAILQSHYGEEIELVVFTSDERCTTPYQLDIYQQEGITVYRSTILHRENMDWHPQDPKMYDLFEQFLELEKPDLVHFHCVQRLTGSVVEATRDMGIPYIVTAHDAWWISDFQFLVDSEGKLYPDGHPDRFAPRLLPNNVNFSESIERIEYLSDLLLSAREVLTVSEAFAEIYRKNGFSQILVNRNGISSNQPWAPKDTSDNPRVICGHIGGMSAHKGFFLLKKAVEQIQPAHISMMLVDHSKDESYVEKTQWGDVPVTIIGRVPQNRIVELYRQLDVLFAPSIWPESYGLVTREAAACGCWVVASNLGGIGEDVIDGETGIIIDPDLMSICDAVEKIDQNVNLFKQAVGGQQIRTAHEQVTELMETYR
ncbi:glycosyltransferase [Enterobacter vonholyi]|uniref:glycosyltransferase n=1 Tax=Enterobacteriaceae TaxID=543 RepID=UPI000E211F2A|nr:MULTISPECIES: glycosyltransferase [Enterobacteriaceae]MCL5637141.1 glycosyltransferase [Enterobacter vonholyi]